MNRRLSLLFVVMLGLMLFVSRTEAQVTTSSITGTVKDATGNTLPGATVKATHEPSGTVYGNIANIDGRFVIPNVRIGGPYTVEVSSVGSQTRKYTGINLLLGEPFILNAVLTESATELQEVVVTSDRTIDVDKVGSATNINNRTLMTMPSISRSLTDFTRLTPQSNGTSFAGRDGRFNNIQVDGANLNNNFGLSSDPLPGGGSSPISLDAYEEVSVNIAPYDVRQSGFTGAGINAVTKSGTNTFKGTAYTFWRNQDYLGTKVGDEDISDDIIDSKNNIYGLSIGGPIIKNKLFFFVNYETEKGSRPGINFSPTNGSGNGNVSAATVEDLQAVSDKLRNDYQYETGAFDNFPNFGNENKKILAKIDYNLNQNHRLTFKYSHFKSLNDQQLNNTSVPNGGGFTVTTPGGPEEYSRLPFNRFSNNAMSYANSNYQFEDKVNTGTLELNSTFQGKASNQFLATITKVETTRVFDGPIFPSIDIFDGEGSNYIFAGVDPYTNNNKVINDVFTITDNFTYYLGKHTITAGGTYEQQRVGNMFMAASNSYYIFNSVDEFLNDQAPVYYAYTYSLVPGEKAVYSAELNIGQLGLYVQDELSFGNLKLTAGLRVDKPIYLDKPLENPSVSEVDFYDADGNLTNYTTGEWPKSKLLVSPRIGARWDAKGDQSLIVRGGTGLFTGRIPFVFLTNMPTNSGMYQLGVSVTDPVELASYTFNKNPDAYAGNFPTTAGGSVPRNLVFMDRDFKFPQIFRTNIAVDKKLPYGLTATFEALITKDINAVRMRNANMNTPDGVIVEEGHERPRFDQTPRSLNSSVSSAIVLENTKKGYSTALTAQLSKSYTNGFYGSIAYTYSRAEEVTANPGSQASSVWNSNPNVGTSNAIELANSQYVLPHRVIANVSYRKEYANFFATTLSLFYQGAHQDNYSFVVNGDLNGDGNSSTDLMYIPNDVNNVNFVEYTTEVNDVEITFTPEQQAAAFEKFINNSDYLKKNRGEYAERNKAYRPWYNRLDLRFLQDFYISTGNDKRHTLQFSLDIFNFGNMLNKNWGIQQRTVTTNPLRRDGIDATTNEPRYTWQNIGGKLVESPFEDVISTSSTWSMQMGLRYSF